MSDNGKPPEPYPIIDQVIQFKDGSRIRVIVEALINPDWDDATNAYYNMLLPVLDEMEFPDD